MASVCPPARHTSSPPDPAFPPRTRLPCDTLDTPTRQIPLSIHRRLRRRFPDALAGSSFCERSCANSHTLPDGKIGSCWRTRRRRHEDAEEAAASRPSPAGWRATGGPTKPWRQSTTSPGLPLPTSLFGQVPIPRSVDRRRRRISCCYRARLRHNPYLIDEAFVDIRAHSCFLRVHSVFSKNSVFSVVFSFPSEGRIRNTGWQRFGVFCQPCLYNFGWSGPLSDCGRLFGNCTRSLWEAWCSSRQPSPRRR